MRSVYGNGKNAVLNRLVRRFLCKLCGDKRHLSHCKLFIIVCKGVARITEISVPVIFGSRLRPLLAVIILCLIRIKLCGIVLIVIVYTVAVRVKACDYYKKRNLLYFGIRSSLICRQYRRRKARERHHKRERAAYYAIKFFHVPLLRVSKPWEIQLFCKRRHRIVVYCRSLFVCDSTVIHIGFYKSICGSREVISGCAYACIRSEADLICKCVVLDGENR